MKQLYSRSARFYMLALVLMLLSTPTLVAQPIYNQKNVTQTSWTVFNLSKTFRALAYSTDPAGQNKQIRLGSLKESGLPPIEIVAMNANFEPSHFIFNNNTGKYECANPLFTSEDGVSVLWGIQEILKILDSKFGWKGLDGTGALPIKVQLWEDQKATAGYGEESNFLIIGKAAGGKSAVRTDVLGVLIATGIGKHKHGLPIEFGKDSAPICSEFYSIVDGSATALGCYFRNKIEVNPTYNWKMGEDIFENTRADLQNPKTYGFPDTYYGENYMASCNAGSASYPNSSIIYHLIYKIAEGSGGPKVNDHGTPYNFLGLGVEKAIQILWETLPKLTVFSDFQDMRKKMLLTVHQMGYPIGSEEDLVVRKAWEAVGLGNDLVVYNADCVSGQDKQILTWYNGLMPAHVRISTSEAAKNSPKITTLVDCISTPKTTTLLFNPEKPGHFIDTNDPDEIYTLDNDVNLSRHGTTVHALVRVARNYFKTRHKHWGVDATGKEEIVNVVGMPNALFQPGYDAVKNQFHFSADKTTLSLDQIAGVYFEGIYQNLKKPSGPPNVDDHAIQLGLKDVFGLSVSNEQRQLVGQEPVWTIGSDVFGGADYLRSFSDPSAREQRSFYYGTDWISATAEARAGVINFWFYLISNGTPGNQPLKNGEKSAHVFRMEEGLPEQVAFFALTNLLPDPSFEDFVTATELALNQLGYGPGSPEAIANHDAWFLTGLKQQSFLSTLPFGPVYQKDENNNDVLYAWPVQIRAGVKFPAFMEQQLIIVSQDPDFDETKSPVYRAFQATSENIGGLDEKNPGTLTVTAEFFLDEGIYYTKSRIAKVDMLACAQKSIHSQLLCRDLEEKEDWTETRTFTIKKVTSKLLSPATNEVVNPWHTWFNWHSTPGAAAYTLKISDLTDPGIVGEISFDSVDPKGVDDDYQEFVDLAQNRGYQVEMRGKQTAGSPTGVDQKWDAGEKKFVFAPVGQKGPEIFGEWTDAIQIKTDMAKTYLDFEDFDPEMALTNVLSPDNGESVPPFGYNFLLKSHQDNKADGYLYELSDFQPEEGEEMSRHYKTLPNAEDGKEYTYSYTVFKNAKPPFIPVKEYGETATSHFFVDYSLLPTPKPFSPAHEEVILWGSSPAQEIKWNGTAGDGEFEYTMYQTADENIVEMGSTTFNTASIAGATELPQDMNGGYKWKVRMKAQDDDGNWVYGPYSKPFFYWLQPPAVNINNPGNNADPEKLDLSWDAAWAPDGVVIQLMDEQGKKVFSKQMTGSQITLSGLMWNYGYVLHLQAINKPAGKAEAILSQDNFITFHTRDGGININQEVKEYDPNAPEEQSSNPDYAPEVGFSIAVEDLDHDPNLGKGFIYKVTVTGTNGFYKESAYQVANLLDLHFAPFQSLQIVANGNIPETTATYQIKVEITDLNAQPIDLFSTSIIKFTSYVYDFNEFDKLVAGEPNNAFVPLFTNYEEYIMNGREVGTSVTFQFSYKYTDKF